MNNHVSLIIPKLVHPEPEPGKKYVGKMTK